MIRSTTNLVAGSELTTEKLSWSSIKICEPPAHDLVPGFHPSFGEVVEHSQSDATDCSWSELREGSTKLALQFNQALCQYRPDFDLLLATRDKLSLRLDDVEECCLANLVVRAGRLQVLLGRREKLLLVEIERLSIFLYLLPGGLDFETDVIGELFVLSALALPSKLRLADGRVQFSAVDRQVRNYADLSS